MDRSLLPHLPVVAAVARHASFARAASELQMSPSAVSHAVRVIETHLGQPMFLRTTRSVRLTDAGRDLLDAVQPGLTYLSEVAERLRADRGRVSGTLRLNVPRVALPHLTPLLVRAADAHPELTVEIIADEALSDIIGQGFDAGIRLGNMIAQDMVAVRLTPPFRAVMVAAPAYIARRGMPKAIGDLQAHACIGYRQLASGGVYDWELAEHGHDVSVRVSGPVRITDGLYARELALAGLGIAYVFDTHVGDDIAAGRLIQILPETAIEEPGFFVYFPERQRHAPKLRALLDLIHP